MLFDETHEAREAYFARIKSDPQFVEYGSALRHASSVNLGFWGSDDDLFDDCSFVMFAEITKFVGRQCRLVDVQHSQVWHDLYDSARCKPNRRLANVYQELADGTGNQALVEEAQRLTSKRQFFGDTPPYQLVYEDIQKKGVMS